MALLYIMCVFIMQLYAAFSPSHCFHYTRYILRKQCRPRSKQHYGAFDLHVGLYIFLWLLDPTGILHPIF